MRTSRKPSRSILNALSCDLIFLLKDLMEISVITDEELENIRMPSSICAPCRVIYLQFYEWTRKFLGKEDSVEVTQSMLSVCRNSL